MGEDPLLSWESIRITHVGHVSSAQWTSATGIIAEKPQSLDKRVAGQITLKTVGVKVNPSLKLLQDLRDALRDVLEERQTESSESDEHAKQSKKEGNFDDERANDNPNDNELDDHIRPANFDALSEAGLSVGGGCTDLGTEFERLLTERIKPQIDATSDSNRLEYECKLEKLVSRNKDRHCNFYRLVLIGQASIVFVPLTRDSAIYKLWMSDESLVISGEPVLPQQQRVWLETRLAPRLAAWLTDNLTNSQGSLQLVDLEVYCREYARLKSKYAPGLVASWTETSDPEKSVHEDVGIAAYLSCLWASGRGGSRKQRFVDLGCGNGLLVFILSGEGHEGVGLDLRRRGIWDTFPNTVKLKEEAVIPSLDTRFSGVDWILGNHSDELTPWIPVIAALSGPETSYWVLPCCPFDFNVKYMRRNANNSVFRDYLDFVTEVGAMAGFEVKEDKMRIPSTKRICLVGRPSRESLTNYETRITEIREFVSSKIRNFKPRDKVERVRNCTKIGADIINCIVNSVVDICLGVENRMVRTATDVGSGNWNAGGEFPLGEVVRRLQEAGVDLQRLKAECGGLQTLLRNHHSIFLVQKGKVKLRVPGTEVSKVKNPKVKSRDCWFHMNHPDGCLLADQDCTWIHPSQ